MPVARAFEPRRDGSYVADVTQVPKANAPGLFEVHAFATTTDGAVQRDAKTAFGVAGASARFAGAATGTMTKSGAPSVRFAVENASAGRYNVAAVLYGTDGKGALVPAAIAHSAAWLEPGTSLLGLSFAADTITEHGLSAPFEVRDLTLTNQVDQGVVEMRARAYVIE